MERWDQNQTGAGYLMNRLFLLYISGEKKKVQSVRRTYIKLTLKMHSSIQ